jgi:hypothetical protein
VALLIIIGLVVVIVTAAIGAHIYARVGGSCLNAAVDMASLALDAETAGPDAEA